MKFWLSFFNIYLFAALAVWAQVTVEVVSEPDYLPGEELEIKVRITNLSGQTVQLGKETRWLTFAIEGLDSFIVPQRSAVPVQGEFDLESAKVAIRRVDLAPHYDLTRPGRYTVTATVKFPSWPKPFSSKAKSFSIMSGVKLWEQEFGAPNSAGRAPEVRKYALLQAQRQKQSKLFVRVTDPAETKIFHLSQLGPMMSFSFTTLERQLDKASNLHVLFQTGAQTFNYSVINPTGEIVARQTHEFDPSTRRRPTLGSDNDGNIAVVGGTRRVAATDLPEPPKANPSDGKPAIKP
jgi:hypothetical protein